LGQAQDFKLKNVPATYKEVRMKNMSNWLGPQSLRFCAIAFAVGIVLASVGCGDGSGLGNNYFEFDSASGTITGYDDDGPRDVTLPSHINGIKVTIVGKNAFRGKRLTGVSIFTSITTIEEGAFAENRLTKVIIDSVTNIKASAFEDNQLTTVTIPNSVIAIGEKAFADNRLTSVGIGNNVAIIGKSAFAGNNLTSVIIPNSVENVMEDAFSGNPLTSVTIGSSKNYASNIVPNFGTVYINNGRQAGTYTQVDSSTWTK
jgi:hypothetical protein